MTMTPINTITGGLEDLARFYMFGFVVDEKGQKAFLHTDTFHEAGFTKEQMTETSVLVVEVIEASQGLKVTRVVSLDGVAGTLPTLKKVSAPKPVVESPPITLNCFVNTTQLDCNKETGDCVFVVKTKAGKYVQTVIVKDGVVTRQLGSVSQKEARLAIGKTVKEAGGKTNDPSLSQVMQGSSSGGGSKKKAAVGK
jgi:hypothetical protein